MQRILDSQIIRSYSKDFVTVICKYLLVIHTVPVNVFYKYACSRQVFSHPSPLKKLDEITTTKNGTRS